MTTPDQSTYATLQNAHQELLRRAEAGGDALTVEEVQRYIEQVKAGAENVSDLRDRNQLRAVLRYWAAWVFERTNVYPDTTLRPAQVTDPEKELRSSRINLLRGFFVLAFLGIVASLISIIWSSSSARLILQTQTVGVPFPFETMVRTYTYQTLTPDAAIIPTYTGVPLPLTPTVSPTGHLLPQFTNTLEPSPTPTATSTPEVIIITTTPLPEIPSPTPRPTETVTGASQERDVFEMLIGSEPQKPIPDCSARSITLQNANPELFADLRAVPSTVRVSRVGDDQALFEGKLPLSSADEIEIQLEDPDLSQAYLVQIEHPLFSYPSLIVQFGDDCQKNHVLLELRYPGKVPDKRNLPNHITQAEDPASAPLAVEWFLTAWGPVPAHPGTWSAEVLVTAVNNDEGAIFWDLSGPEPRLLPDRRLVLVTENCQTTFRRIGVSSGGQSAQKEIILRPAACSVR